MILLGVYLCGTVCNDVVGLIDGSSGIFSLYDLVQALPVYRLRIRSVLGGITSRVRFARDLTFTKLALHEP